MPTKKTVFPTAPFSRLGYDANQASCQRDEASCAVCGKPCYKGIPWEYSAHVVAGGARFVLASESGLSWDDDPGNMDWFPVGPNCARHLIRQGVLVKRALFKGDLVKT